MKFPELLQKGFDISHMCEYITNIHWKRIAYAIALGRVKDTKNFIKSFYWMINPPSADWSSHGFKDDLILQDYSEWNNQIQQLYESIYGQNPLKEMRQ